VGLRLRTATVVAVAVCLLGSLVGTATVLIALNISPRLGTRLIRSVFEKDAADVKRAMEAHAPGGISSSVDQPYRSGDDHARLDVYFPETVGPDERLPTVVWTHGGAWISGHKDDAAPYFQLIAAEGYAVYALFGDGSAAPGGVWAAWAADWVWTFSIGLLPFVFLLFPNGRLPSRRWRPVAFFAAALYVALPVGYALLPGSLGSFPSIENPMGYGGAEDEILPGVNQALVWIALVLTVLLSVVSLMLRFRRAVGVERQQIKWVAYTAVLLITYALVDLFFQDVITPVAPVLDAVFVGSFYAAIAVAILKHRLYDIDVIINRTLVYGILTATLALVYFGSVVLLQRAFVLLTGETSQLTVVASTLAIAALFNPLRWRVQAFVDRRFYRRKYDARKTLEEFSARLRDETDLGALNDELVEVVRDTVQPAHVSLWLRTADRTRNPDSRGEPEASG